MSPSTREPALAGQTVVVVGGSAGIGLATARRARAEGADVILTARDPGRLRSAGDEVGARSVAAFDANDLAALEGFFDGLDGPIDHVMVTAGAPYYAPLVDMDFEDVRRAIAEHPMVMLGVARYTAGRIRPGGTLLFMGGTGARRPGVGLGITAAMRLTRTGAISSARFAARTGSAAVIAAVIPRPTPGRRAPVPPMNRSVPPGRILPAV